MPSGAWHIIQGGFVDYRNLYKEDTTQELKCAVKTGKEQQEIPRGLHLCEIENKIKYTRMYCFKYKYHVIANSSSS